MDLSPGSWRPAFQAAWLRRLGPAAARLREVGERDAAVLQWTIDVVDPARTRPIAEDFLLEPGG